MTVRAIFIATGIALIAVSHAVAGTGAATPLKGVTSAERARTNYILECQGCHRADAGETPNATPALAGFMGRFLSVPGGREYLIRAPGVAMAPLSDTELAELLNWILGTFDAGNVPVSFKPFSAAEIKRLRKAPLRTDAASMRASLIRKMRINDQ